jgi:drug/metabolite transporter (DMT)-like permease
VTKWLLVAVIVASNCFADLLNTFAMRRHGKVHDLRPSGIARLVRVLSRNGYVLGGVVANAVGFFAFMSLLSIANVSFAVPATAASFVVETWLAKVLLKEDVHWQRWAGAFVIAVGVALLALP